MEIFSLAATGGTDNPCLIILRDKGYRLEITRTATRDGGEHIQYSAYSPQAQFLATSGPELLGLVTLWETFGTQWKRSYPNICEEIWPNEVDTEQEAVAE